MSTLQDAEQLAYKYFKNKTDKGGNPYMQHLRFVKNHCMLENSKIVGVLHDILEDTDCSISELREVIVHEDLIQTIQLLTRKQSEKYSEYIDRIVNSKNINAIEVKLHDLENNMDITRLKSIKQKDIDRIRKYKKAYNRIWSRWIELFNKQYKIVKKGGINDDFIYGERI